MKKEKPGNSGQEKPSGEITPEMLVLLGRDFAFHCRNLRRNLGMTQTAFAEEMGVKNKQAKITVSRWESGTVPQKRYLLKFFELQRRFDNRNFTKTKKDREYAGNQQAVSG